MSAPRRSVPCASGARATALGRAPGRLVTALLLLGLAWPVRAQDAQRDEVAQDVFARVSDSVATVLGLDAAGRARAQGSGVWLAPGRLVTNCHVVRDAARLELRTAQASLPARWVLQDPSRDLCLLQADAAAGRAAVLPPAAAVPAIGERVHAVGNPLGFGLAVSSGLVSGFTEMDGERVIVASAALSPGSSGGGVFDGEGRLLGIATAILSAGQNLNIVLPAAWVGELPRRGVAPVQPPAPPAPEPRWMDEAEALQRAAAWPRLELHARAWGQAQPTSATARRHLAMALLNQDRVAAAEATLREALQLDEHSSQTWYCLGSVLNRAGRPAEAEQAMDRALALMPALAEVYMERSTWRLAEGRPALAQAEAERAVAIEPQIPLAWSTLGDALNRLGRGDEALRAYRTALALSPRVEGGPPASGSGAGPSWDVRLRLGIGVAELGRQRYAMAEDAFRQVTGLAPGFAEGWEKLGMALARLQRDAEALPALDRALQLDPRRLEARIERSAVRARRGERAGALDDAREATVVAPGAAQAWRLLGILLHETGDAHAALAAYQRLDALGQAGVDDLAQLGDLLGRAGERGAAQAVFDRAEALAPRHAGLLVAVAAFHGRAGDLERSVSYLERALVIEPRNANAISSLGYTQLLRGAPEEAVKTLERAVALAPTLAAAWINLGHAWLRSRNLGRAIAALEKGLTLAPEAADAHLYLAQALLGARDAAQARQHVERVLEKLPELPAALSLAALANLMEGRDAAAAAHHSRLRSRDPQGARKVRAQALAVGLGGAAAWPE